MNLRPILRTNSGAITAKVSALITKFWETGEALKAVQRELSVMEGVIADEVEVMGKNRGKFYLKPMTGVSALFAGHQIHMPQVDSITPEADIGT